MGHGHPSAGRRSWRRDRRDQGFGRAGTRSRGFRRRGRPHRQGHRGGPAVPDRGMVAGDPVIVVEHVTRLRAICGPIGRTGPRGRVLPRRDHRRAVLCHGRLPDQPQWGPQLCGDPGCRGPDRERHPGRCRRRPESGRRSTCRWSPARASTARRDQVRVTPFHSSRTWVPSAEVSIVASSPAPPSTGCLGRGSAARG